MVTRILQIIPSFDRGGAEKQLTLLATRLPRDRFEIHVCGLTRGGPLAKYLKEQEIPVTVIGKTWKADPFAYLRLQRFIQRLRPDIVHTWLFAANSYGRYASLRNGIKRLISGERCVDQWKTRIQLAIDRYLAKRTSALVFPSEGVRDFYAKHGITTEKHRVIPNGVSRCAPTDPLSREAVLKELNLPSGARLIAVVARLWPQKRIRDAIWGAELLSAIRDDAHLLVIGDGPLKWKLRRYSEKVHRSGQIHFLGHRNDVPRLMPHFDCLWLASTYEGLPNSILEAMAAGVPVVATDIPGNRELVTSNQTGYLVGVGDQAGFARHTNDILDNAELKSRLGEAGQRKVLNHYSVEKMVDRYALLYQEVMNE